MSDWTFKGNYIEGWDGTPLTPDAYVGNRFQTLIHNIYEPESSVMGIEAYLECGIPSLQNRLISEEIKQKDLEPSRFKIYGLDSEGDRVLILSLIRFPMDMNVRGEINISIDSSPSDTDAVLDVGDQVLQLRYDLGITSRFLEYIGTPAELIFAIAEGTEFAETEFVEPSYNPVALSTLADFTTWFTLHYPTVVSLQPVHDIFVDTKNSFGWSLWKAFASLFAWMTQSVYEFYDSFFIKSCNLQTLKGLLSEHNTKIWSYDYAYNNVLTIDDIEYDHLGNMTAFTVSEDEYDYVLMPLRNGFIYVNPGETWSPSGDEELIQYATRNGNRFAGFVRGLNQVNRTIAIGDTITLISNEIRTVETTDVLRARLAAYTGSKGTLSDIQKTCYAAASLCEGSTITVFDLFDHDQTDLTDIKNWVCYVDTPKGWLLDVDKRSEISRTSFLGFDNYYRGYYSNDERYADPVDTTDNLLGCGLDYSNPLLGAYPIFIWAKNWIFEKEYLQEIADKLKPIGATPHILWNTQVDMFHLSIVNTDEVTWAYPFDVSSLPEGWDE